MKNPIATLAGLGLMISALGCTAPPPTNPTAPPPEQGQAPAVETAETTPEVPAESATEDPYAGLNFQNGWARIPFNFTVFGGYGPDQMNDVAAGGPGAVVVGFGMRNGDMDAAVWHSPDGLRWTRIEGMAELGGPGTQTMAALAAGEGGIVAVGSETLSTNSDAAVWFSQNGLAWSRVPETGTTFGDDGNQQMNHVTAFGSGFVAVGVEKTETEIRGAVWTSQNGIGWQRVPHDEAVFGGASRYVSLEEVYKVGDSLLATGSVMQPDADDVDVAVWFSHDGGTSWTAISNSEAALGDPEAIRYQLVSAIAQGPGGFYMAGTEQNIAGTGADEYVNGIIWTSSDGVNWQRAFDHKPDFHQQTMLDIISGTLGFAIVGFDITGDQVQAAVWQSADGLNWTQITHFESVFGGTGIQQMNAVAEAGPGLVAVGMTTENGELDTAVWIYVPEKANQD